MLYSWTLTEDGNHIRYFVDGKEKKSYFPEWPNRPFSSLEEAQKDCFSFWCTYLEDLKNPTFVRVPPLYINPSKIYPIMASIFIETDNRGTGWNYLVAFHDKSVQPFNWRYSGQFSKTCQYDGEKYNLPAIVNSYI